MLFRSRARRVSKLPHAARNGAAFLHICLVTARSRRQSMLELASTDDLLHLLITHKADLDDFYLRIQSAVRPSFVDSGSYHLIAVQKAVTEAAAKGDLKAVTAALENNPSSVAKPDARGWNALQYAAATGNLRVLRALLKHASVANLEETTPKHPAPMVLAINNSHPAIVEELLSFKASINAVPSSTKLSPLLSAVAADSPALIKLLLERKADGSGKAMVRSTCFKSALICSACTVLCGGESQVRRHHAAGGQSGIVDQCHAQSAAHAPRRDATEPRDQQELRRRRAPSARAQGVRAHAHRPERSDFGALVLLA